jgi:lipid-A-disaccharide synthase
MVDLFILAAEASADAHGARLIKELLEKRPDLNISAVAGPNMRALPINTVAPMEQFQVMGFYDVLMALPRLVRHFFRLRDLLLQLNPKAILCIDYPGFNLRLEKSLRKKGYKGQLIHYICPTVWAWRKKRILSMNQSLNLLLTIFPFEKKYFKKSNIQVEYVGHPLIHAISNYAPSGNFREQYQLSGKILGLFPGSRKSEIEKNFPLQLKAAQKLCQLDPELQIAISIASQEREAQIWSMAGLKAVFIPPQHTYDLMRHCHLAFAKSGTVTLELALHKVPTVVTYAIRPLDRLIIQKIFKVNLPFYCIVNIIASKSVFPELFGPRFTVDGLRQAADVLLNNAAVRFTCQNECSQMQKLLGTQPASQLAAEHILNHIFNQNRKNIPHSP